jgi:glycosyltransferase involved in cell wall biosynthesis
MLPALDPAAPAPRVSVIMPLFNARPFLAETIASLEAQNWPDLELIAVDDGSSDGSPELFAKLCPRATLIRQSNRGPSAARNAAIARATGRYLAFLDADDLWPAGKLARQVARLEADPALEAVLGLIQLFTDQLSADGSPLPATREWGQPFFLFLLGGMVCRRELFSSDQLGGFDEARFPFQGEDTDWFLRAWENARRMEILEDVSIFYRRRAGSLTQNPDDTKRGFAGLLLTSIKRRRGPDGKLRPLPDTLKIPVTVRTRA